jgi:hypothetical protein
MGSAISRRERVLALVVTATVAAASFAAIPPSADARGERRVDITALMTGLACIESGGSYTATNRTSGAYGKYQIMPRNWPSWAGRYMRDRWAEPTPRNQEFVARSRITELYELRGSWRRVAYWWLTGDGEPDPTLWSAKAFGYVNRVMAVAVRAASPDTVDKVPDACFPRDFIEPTIRTEPRQRVRITAGLIYVRTAAGYENRAIKLVGRGLALPVLKRGSDPRGKLWLRIGLKEGRTGWIASWYTEPISR